jgi:hypothetical protein
MLVSPEGRSPIARNRMPLRSARATMARK